MELFKNNNKEELDRVISTVLELIRITTYMLIPVMPASCTKILDELGCSNYLGESFDEFTRWGYVDKMNSKYKNRKFFDKIEA